MSLRENAGISAAPLALGCRVTVSQPYRAGLTFGGPALRA